jgi:hypothetical protein
MLIGLRLLLMVALIASAATLLGYLFTRQPRFLLLTKTIVKVTLLVAGLIGLIYLLERAVLI